MFRKLLFSSFFIVLSLIALQNDKNSFTAAQTTPFLQVDNSNAYYKYDPFAELVIPDTDPNAQLKTRAIEEKDGFAYLLTREGDLHTYDIRNLQTRSNWTTYNTPISSLQITSDSGTGLLRNGDYLYVFSDYGIKILNIQNPAVPTIINTKNDLVIYNLIMSNNLLVAVGERYMAIYSLSNPTNPSLLTKYYLGNGKNGESAAVFGNTLYITDSTTTNIYSLRVFDISNPSYPAQIRSISRNASGNHLRVLGDQLIECADFSYINGQWGSQSLHLWGLSNPTNPILLDSRTTSGTRVCAVHEGNIVLNGNVWRSNGTSLEFVDSFDKGYSTVDGASYGSITRSDFIFLGQSPRILIVKAEHKAAIEKIEVLQVIQQDVTYYVPLITNKPTFVRAYLSCGEGCNSLEGVNGVLHAYGPSGELPSSPIDSLNGPITVSNTDMATLEGDLGKTLNFRIPLSWTVGTIYFNLILDDSSSWEIAEFQEMPAIDVMYVPVSYLGGTPDEEAMSIGSNWAKRVYPIAELNYVPGSSIDFVLCGPECDFLFKSRLNLIYFLSSDIRNNYDFLFAWFPGSTISGGQSDAYWGIPGREKVAYGPSYPINGQLVFAHEIAHLLGMRHVKAPSSCPNYFWDQDSQWPYYDDPTTQVWGVDGSIFSWLVSNSSILKNPDTTYDVMGCSELTSGEGLENRWISPFTYYHLYDRIHTELGTGSTATSQSLLEENLYVISSGLIHDDGTVEMDPGWIISSMDDISQVSTGTEYCLEVFDSSDVVLDSYCFDGYFKNYETGEETTVTGFFSIRPYHANMEKVILRTDTNTLSERIISDNAPSIEILAPQSGDNWSTNGTYTISWNGSDIDGDDLVYSVLYSPNGTDWRAIAISLTETSVDVDTSELPGGTAAKVKILATDGINTTEVATDFTFSVGTKAPVVTIYEPENSHQIKSDTPIFLEGYAYDLEDGVLDDSRFVWHSNLDGYLGTGKVILAPLSNGEHVISLTVTDSDNNETTATIELTAGAKAFLPMIKN